MKKVFTRKELIHNAVISIRTYVNLAKEALDCGSYDLYKHLVRSAFDASGNLLDLNVLSFWQKRYLDKCIEEALH